MEVGDKLIWENENIHEVWNIIAINEMESLTNGRTWREIELRKETEKNPLNYKLIHENHILECIGRNLLKHISKKDWYIKRHKLV